MAETGRLSIQSWQRWVIALSLPLLLLSGLGFGALWLEYRAQFFTRHLGLLLLEHNGERPTRGSVWQGILASRRTRSSLENPSSPSTLEPGTIPRAILQHRYEMDQRSANFLILRVDRRILPLHPERLTSTQMQELARSLQVYEQGRELLSHIDLPRDPFRIHARIRAQLHLEDGSLFPLLHAQLLAADAPEAWNFVRMSETDRRYWKDLLAQVLDPPSEGDANLPEQAPQVVAALNFLVRTWEDSLLADELHHLRETWDSSPDVELRIVRNMDVFTGYAVLPGELPAPFTIPALKAESLLGIAVRQEGEL